MFTFILLAEIISVNFAEPEVIDLDQDTYEIVAADENSAIESLKEQVDYRTEYGARSVSAVQVYGRVEDENF